MGRLRLVDHALAQHKLSHMRDQDCRPTRFRRLMRQASLLLCSEMTRDLDLEEREITTANGVRTMGRFRDQSNLVIMPILRGGLVMGEAFSELLSVARTGHIGIYRDSQNDHHCYMLSLPRVAREAKIILLDPVISQGATIGMAADYLLGKNISGSHIRIGCILASEPGVRNFYGEERRRDIDIFAIAQDPELDENHFLIPGMGNVSDRLYRTNEAEIDDAGGYA